MHITCSGGEDDQGSGCEGSGDSGRKGKGEGGMGVAGAAQRNSSIVSGALPQTGRRRPVLQRPRDGDGGDAADT